MTINYFATVLLRVRKYNQFLYAEMVRRKMAVTLVICILKHLGNELIYQANIKRMEKNMLVLQYILATLTFALATHN